MPSLADAIQRAARWERVETVDVSKCPEWAHEGQRKVWESEARVKVVCCGAQSGKSALQPHLILRDIQQTAKYFSYLKEYGEHAAVYLVIGPTTEVLKNKLLPMIAGQFAPYGSMNYSGKPIFKFSKEGSKRLCGQELPIELAFCYSSDPNNLEAYTALGYYWDEAGQSTNKELSYDAAQRRISLAVSLREKYKIPVGLETYTSTPYDWGWYKRRVVDPAMRGESGTEYFSWPTWANPNQSKESAEQKLRDGMDEWRWRMMYMGEWTRPEGAVYPGFDSSLETKDRETNVCEEFDPGGRTVHVGIDFGPQNTAAVFVVEFEDGTLKVWKTYHSAGDASIHAERFKGFLKGQRLGVVCGGAPSENQWRSDFAMAGFPVNRPAIKSSEQGALETGIDRVSRQINTKKLKVARNNKRLIDDLEGYSFAKDGDERTLRTIADKQFYHLPDALRYIVGTLRPGEHGGVSRHRLVKHDQTPYSPTEDPKLFSNLDQVR